MSTYSDYRKFFKIRINVSDLDQFYPIKTTPAAKEYEAELIIENIDRVHIKIFFDANEELAEKFCRWAHEFEGNYLKKIDVLGILSPDNLVGIDLTKSSPNGYEYGSFEENGVSYFILFVNNVEIQYKRDSKRDSMFYLNDAALNLIELNYHHSTTSFFEDKEFELKPQNRRGQKFHFGKIKFTPEHNFYVEGEDKGERIVIRKEPRFRVEFGEIDKNEVKEHVKLLCVLYSFYSHREIEVNTYKMYNGESYYFGINKVSRLYNEGFHGAFLWDFDQEPLNLILNVNVGKCLDSLDLVTKLVDRYNQALLTNDETKFILLYSVLEQLRSQCAQGETDKESSNYKFLVNKKRLNQKLKEVLGEVKNLIIDEQKDHFESHLESKIPLLKLKTMKNQFQSYFISEGLDFEKYEVDFNEIITLRNILFHGNSLEGKVNRLNYINHYKRFPRFVGVALMKFLGISDVSNIEKLGSRIHSKID
jgi:hypothetical protein